MDHLNHPHRCAHAEHRQFLNITALALAKHQQQKSTFCPVQQVTQAALDLWCELEAGVLHHPSTFTFANVRHRIGVGLGHATCVDQISGKSMVFGEPDGGVAKQALCTIGRSQVPCSAVGDLHIALGRYQALLVVAVEQFGRCHAPHDCSQFPGQVIGIGYAGVAASRAKRADHFGGVADEEHPPMAKMVQTLGLVGVRAHPDNLTIDIWSKLLGEAFTHDFFATDISWVGIGGHLVINAPNIVSHQMLPNSAVVIERRFNPSVSLSGRRVVEAHIGDAPAIIPALAVHGDAAPSMKRCV